MASQPKIRSSQPSEFDAYSGSYNAAVNSALAFTGMKVDFFTRVKMDYLIDIIGTNLPASGAAHVLDVGCGIGYGHPLLIDRIGALTGIDVSEKMIERARELNPRVCYASYGGLELPFPDKNFDVVFAVSVFHHVPLHDRATLVHEIRRVLRPLGVFVIFEHNPRNPFTMRVVNNCEFDKDAVLLDRCVSEALMATAGFQNVSTRFILTIPAVGTVLRSFDRLFSTFPIGAQYYTIGRA
jgi:SAM-dependent methyltransferase